MCPNTRLQRARALACSLALAAAAPWAAAQDVELFARPDFGGARLAVDSTTPDLGRFGLADRVSSLVISRGRWVLCTEAQFRGACITLGPGRYDRLPPDLNNNLASLRPVSDTAVRPPQPPPPPPQTSLPPPRPGQAAIVLYAGDFTGPELRLFDSVRDLQSHAFNDSATTVDVLAGVWELCSDGGFSGQCQRFGPGRHALPPALRDRLSSLRPLDGGFGGAPQPRPGFDPGAPGTRPWAGAAPAIVFYENHDYSGRQLPLVGAAPSLGAMDFNDRASAVEVFRGRWQLCRHGDFGGECLVFGPGRYALGGQLNDAVSSARPLFGRAEQPMAAIGAVTLHDHGDFRGRSLLVDGPVGNLRDLSFNDRTQAIEVHGGRWELCSASDFRGRCLEFGPGWHRLPAGLAGELTSLRPR